MKCLPLFVLPLALCAAGVALAAPADDAPTPTAPAMKAGIDRDTGRLRALTAQEARELAERDTGARAAGAELRRAGIRVPETEAEALETQRIHADGAVSMDVPMSLMNSLVAERDAEGRLVVRHGEAGHAHDASAPAVELADE